jgi:hypothetical protein
VADTNKGRLYVFGAGEELEHRDVVNPKIHRTMIGGWPQARFRMRVGDARANERSRRGELNIG